MNVRYLGHSSFLVVSSKGTTIVTDPFGINIPYRFPEINADVVIVSHEHQDHNAEWRVGGTHDLVKRTTEFKVEYELNIKRTGEKFTFTGIPTYHDKNIGKRRGPNTIWVWHMEGIRYVFMGDIGHVLTDPQLKEVGNDTDVLFLPVGGFSTVGPSEAALIVNQLNPKIVFPMHYQTPQIEMHNIADEPLDKFLNKMGSVEHTYSMSVDLELIRLPKETKVLVLKHE